MALAVEQEPTDLTSDEEDLGLWRLTVFCQQWLRHRSAEGEEYYMRSLVSATNWQPVIVHGGRPDRKYSIAIAEADLTAAMLALPPLPRNIARLSRRDPRHSGWTLRWNKHMALNCGASWREYCDTWAVRDGRAMSIRLGLAIRALLREAATGMADYLGAEWLAGR